MNNLLRRLDDGLTEAINKGAAISYPALAIVLTPHFIPTALRKRRERKAGEDLSFLNKEPTTKLGSLVAEAMALAEYGKLLASRSAPLRYTGKLIGYAYATGLFANYYNSLTHSDHTLTGYLNALSIPIITNICSEIFEQGREERKLGQICFRK